MAIFLVAKMRSLTQEGVGLLLALHKILLWRCFLYLCPIRGSYIGLLLLFLARLHFSTGGLPCHSIPECGGYINCPVPRIDTFLTALSWTGTR